MRSYLFLPTGPEINRALLLTKTDELHRKIKALTSMRDGLRHTAHCTAPNHVEYPKFLRILRVEGKNRNRQPTKLKEKKFKPGVHFTMGGQVRLPPHRRPSLRSSRHRALRGKPYAREKEIQIMAKTLEAERS